MIWPQDFKEGIHYETTESGTPYYICLLCKRYFPQVYYAKYPQLPHHIYGTRQLMALWAWHNFKRHLKKCYQKYE
jgi:hypothetical protein